MAGCFTVAGIVLPETGWLTPDIAKWTFALAVFGVIIGGLLWFIGQRYQQIEDNQLVKTIPQIINDIHILRGKFTDEYVKGIGENNEAIKSMNEELYTYLGGIGISKTIDNIEDVCSTIGNIFKSLPTIKEKVESISDLELGRLVAKSAETHLPINEKLYNAKSYKQLSKKLKTAREKLTKGIAVEATKAIDYYQTYSEGYWALDVLMENIAKQANDSVPLIQTAYNLYRDKFQEQMRLNLAKVCEIVNEYDKQTKV